MTTADILFNFRFLGILRTTMLARKCIKGISQNPFFLKRFRLVGNDGEKFDNPVFTKSSLKTILPIDPQTENQQLVKRYVSDVITPIDSVFYEAGVGSMITKKYENKYTDDEQEDFVVLVIHRINYKYLWISSSIMMTILAIVGITLKILI